MGLCNTSLKSLARALMFLAVLTHLMVPCPTRASEAHFVLFLESSYARCVQEMIFLSEGELMSWTVPCLRNNLDMLAGLHEPCSQDAFALPSICWA